MSGVGSRWRRRRRRQSLPDDGRQPIRGVEEQGDFEVRAWIQADLLGLRLLTVTSRVVTGEPQSFRDGSPLLSTKAVARRRMSPSETTGRSAEARRSSPRSANGRHERQGLEQAVALLDQCNHTLETLERLSSNGGRKGQ